MSGIKNNNIRNMLVITKKEEAAEKEYMELFKSLEDLELSILGKFIFNEECRMNKLKLKDVIYSKFDTNNEWEDYYIEFLKTLDDDSIFNIEMSINNMN